jgi:uncharacterized protein involved in exopolysaccharide biosynthesis
MTVSPKPESFVASRAPPPADVESADLFDYALIWDYFVYFGRSVRRHAFFCAGIFAAVLALAALLLWAFPKTYHAEAKLLAQRNQVIALLGNPGRNMPWDNDMPTRAAAETILRIDNLVSLVRQTNLVNRWRETRAPVGRLKDWVSGLLRRRPIDEEEKIDIMVGTLETKLTVTTGEGTVTIGIDWPDAKMAFLLVDAAQRNFFEARRVSEVSTISEAISILEGRASKLRYEIEEDVEYVEAARNELAKRKPKSLSLPPQVVATTHAKQQQKKRLDDDRAQLRIMLDTKRRGIGDLEESRRRQIAELQSRIDEAKATYSDVHPVVVDLQQRMDTFKNQEDSLQLATLREEMQALEAEAIRRGAFKPQEVRLTRRLPVEPQQLAQAVSAEIEEAPIEQAKGDLRYAITKYQTLLDRIDSAQMELESARAAFKYRYSVLMPAEVPRSPVKPKKTSVMASTAVAGLLLAIFLAGVRDLRSGIVYERWQVLRQLDLPVLGEVEQS